MFWMRSLRTWVWHFILSWEHNGWACLLGSRLIGVVHLARSSMVQVWCFSCYGLFSCAKFGIGTAMPECIGAPVVGRGRQTASPLRPRSANLPEIVQHERARYERTAMDSLTRTVCRSDRPRVTGSVGRDLPSG